MSIFVSDSPYGPWTQQMPWVVAGSGTQEIDGVPWAKGARHVGGNPTALILENGTTLVFFRGGGGNWSQCQKLGVSVKSFSANCTGPNDPNCPKDKVNGCASRPTGSLGRVARASPPPWSSPSLALLLLRTLTSGLCTVLYRSGLHCRWPCACRPLVRPLLDCRWAGDPIPAGRLLHVQDAPWLSRCVPWDGPLANTHAHWSPRLQRGWHHVSMFDRRASLVALAPQPKHPRLTMSHCLTQVVGWRHRCLQQLCRSR